MEDWKCQDLPRKMVQIGLVLDFIVFGPVILHFGGPRLFALERKGSNLGMGRMLDHD